MSNGEAKQGAASATRAGTRALSVLSAPINVVVLTALVDEPKSLIDLRQDAGSPPQTTMRAHLRALSEIGVVEKRRQKEFPGTIEYELAQPGRELAAVIWAVNEWLAASPSGAIELGSTAAKGAIKALVGGWSTRMVRALASRPLSLTDLNQVISGVSYPSLERRLAALRISGLVARAPGRGRATPYTVTEWLRKAVGPLAVAARWEQHHLRGTAMPITNRDVEAAFLLTIRLLQPPPDTDSCLRLTVAMPGNDGARLAGVRVCVEGGRIASCVTRLEGPVDAWITGSASAWLSAMIDRDLERLELGGDSDAAEAVLAGLHTALFTAGAGSSLQ